MVRTARMTWIHLKIIENIWKWLATREHRALKDLHEPKTVCEKEWLKIILEWFMWLVSPRRRHWHCWNCNSHKRLFLQSILKISIDEFNTYCFCHCTLLHIMYGLNCWNFFLCLDHLGYYQHWNVTHSKITFQINIILVVMVRQKHNETLKIIKPKAIYGWGWPVLLRVLEIKNISQWNKKVMSQLEPWLYSLSKLFVKYVKNIFSLLTVSAKLMTLPKCSIATWWNATRV